MRLTLDGIDAGLVNEVHDLVNPIQVQSDAGVGAKIEHGAAFGAWLGDSRQYQFLDDAVAALAAGAEQLLPTEVAVDLAERFPQPDRDAAFLAAFAQIDTEAPDASVGLGLGDQIRVLLGCENSLLCAMRLFHFLHDDGGQLQEFFELGVDAGDADVSEDFLLHFGAVTYRVYDLDAGTVAVGVEFSAYEHGGSYGGKRSRSESLYEWGHYNGGLRNHRR